MDKETYDLIVIGAGPGGYVAAIRAAQLGMRVACVDKRSTLGGTCLNVGCIPSKALLNSSHKLADIMKLAVHGIQVEGVKLDLKTMMAHKDKVVADLTQGIRFLFKKNMITAIEGSARFTSLSEIEVGSTSYQAKNFIIATGSETSQLPGIEIDEKQIVTSTGALALEKVPESMIVVGGGYIGLELGSVWQRLGTKVTVVEYFDRIVPNMDREVGTALFKSLKIQGMEFKLSSKVISSTKSPEGVQVMIEPVSGGEKEAFNCEVLLVSSGRKPFTEGLGLDTIGVKITERGMIEVNERFETSAPGIYAIGDVIRGPMLAHKASEEGVAVVEFLAGQKPHVNYNAIPAVIYTHPEVASVGKTEEELKQEGVPYKIGKFPFSANSRGRSTGDTEGFVKILAHQKSDEILGVHIIHGEAGTMIAEAVVAMEFRASAEDIARICHAHPTLNEALKEAALDVEKSAIHI